MRPSNLLRTIGHESLISLRGLSSIPNDFRIYKDFLNVNEQRMILSTLLRKLDSHESPRTRRRRRQLLAEQSVVIEERLHDDPTNLFAPDEHYEFESVGV
jgi:alkylated DNA repair protein alkB homolog 7